MGRAAAGLGMVLSGLWLVGCGQPVANRRPASPAAKAAQDHGRSPGATPKAQSPAKRPASLVAEAWGAGLLKAANGWAKGLGFRPKTLQKDWRKLVEDPELAKLVEPNGIVALALSSSGEPKRAALDPGLDVAFALPLKSFAEAQRTAFDWSGTEADGRGGYWISDPPSGQAPSGQRCRLAPKRLGRGPMLACAAGPERDELTAYLLYGKARAQRPGALVWGQLYPRELIKKLKLFRFLVFGQTPQRRFQDFRHPVRSAVLGQLFDAFLSAPKGISSLHFSLQGSPKEGLNLTLQLFADKGRPAGEFQLKRKLAKWGPAMAHPIPGKPDARLSLGARPFVQQGMIDSLIGGLAIRGLTLEGMPKPLARQLTSALLARPKPRGPLSIGWVKPDMDVGVAGTGPKPLAGVLRGLGRWELVLKGAPKLYGAYLDTLSRLSRSQEMEKFRRAQAGRSPVSSLVVPTFRRVGSGGFPRGTQLFSLQLDIPRSRLNHWGYWPGRKNRKTRFRGELLVAIAPFGKEQTRVVIASQRKECLRSLRRGGSISGKTGLATGRPVALTVAPTVVTKGRGKRDASDMAGMDQPLTVALRAPKANDAPLEIHARVGPALVRGVIRQIFFGMAVVPAPIHTAAPAPEARPRRGPVRKTVPHIPVRPR